MLDDDQPLRDMDTIFEFSSNTKFNFNFNFNYNDHYDVIYNQVKLPPNGVSFHHYEQGKVKLHYNRPLKAVDHDDK
jgi:hypothetical protein